MQATRWITRAAGRSTSEWTMCPSTGRRRRSRARVYRARKSSRASWRISFRPCSNLRTTSWPWSCSAAKRLWWRNESGKRLQVTGSSILVPVFGKSFQPNRFTLTTNDENIDFVSRFWMLSNHVRSSIHNIVNWSCDKRSLPVFYSN